MNSFRDLGFAQPSSGMFLKNAFDQLPKNKKSLDLICQKKGSDRFRSTFCGTATPPNIKSISDLYLALGMNINFSNFSCTSHSVSLVRNDVSVLNPRCIVFSNTQNDSSALAIGYQRSETTIVEVAARDPQTKELNFYILDYELPCESNVEGCKSGEYFTPKAEMQWQNISFYEDESLKNTAFDCTHCHQPGGPGTAKKFRMTEASFPWNHWLSSDTDCGQSLTNDFQAAHLGETTYAGIPLNLFPLLKAERLEFFVNNNGFKGRSHGNDYFNSFLIESEMKSQPERLSATWVDEYSRRNLLMGLDAFGGVSMPYYGCKQSDPHRLVEFTKIYKDVVSGKSHISNLPALHLVNLDDEESLRARGLMVSKELTDGELLQRACLSCHNSSVDQKISKSHFNAERLDLNSNETIDLAIKRISMSQDDLEVMPPKMFVTLTKEEVLRLRNYLAKTKR